MKHSLAVSGAKLIDLLITIVEESTQKPAKNTCNVDDSETEEAARTNQGKKRDFEKIKRNVFKLPKSQKARPVAVKCCDCDARHTRDNWQSWSELAPDRMRERVNDDVIDAKRILHVKAWFQKLEPYN